MTTISEGWVYHDIPYSTPPTLSGNIYQFGIIPADQKAMLNTPLSFKIDPATTFGVYTPTVSVTSKTSDQIAVRFVPINGVFLYWMLGKVSDLAGVKTITTMDGTARKPRLGLWQQTDTKKYHHYGAVFHSMQLEYEFGLGFTVLLAGKGLTHGTDANTPTLLYPTSIETEYVHFTSMSWNGGSLLPSRFALQSTQQTRGYIASDGQYYQDINEYSPIFSTYNLQFSSTYGEDLWTDFLAGTKRTFIWRISKADNTKYIQCSSNAIISSLIPTRTYGDAVVYSATMITEAITGTVVDGLLNALYNL